MSIELKSHILLRYKVSLSFMLFFQYMMFAVWWVPLAAYLTNLEVENRLKALILSSMAIGCLFSPIIGMLADRFFSGQRMLALLNIINAVMLLFAALTNNPTLLFIILLVAMLVYMPTWSLSSSIALAHLPPEQFPKVRSFGSIGWVTSGIFSVVFIELIGVDFDGTNLPFYCGAAASFIAAITNLFLPNTPPLAKDQQGSLIDAFGLRTIQMMKDKNFRIFIIFSFLSLIPFAMYFSYFSEFLLDKNVKYISITMNWGVLAEMGFLLLVPPAIKRFGLQTVLNFGLLALVIRFVSFFTGGIFDQSWMNYIGILVHGLIFGFFYVGGQIYTDLRAPKAFKSQAQGFIFLVTFGAGLLVGNLLSGALIDTFSNEQGYDWDTIWGITTLFSVVLLVAFGFIFNGEDTSKMTFHKVKIKRVDVD